LLKKVRHVFIIFGLHQILGYRAGSAHNKVG